MELSVGTSYGCSGRAFLTDSLFFGRWRAATPGFSFIDFFPATEREAARRQLLRAHTPKKK